MGHEESIEMDIFVIDTFVLPKIQQNMIFNVIN